MLGNNKTLWVFGDSNTAGHGCTYQFDYYKKYHKEGDGIWPIHLSEWLDVDLENRGRNGSSNDLILDKIIDSFEEIKEGDIVIIGKTFSHRFDIPQKEGLNSVFWDWKEFAAKEHTSQFTQEQIEVIVDFQYYFMDSPLFVERWNKRFQWISELLERRGCRVIVWDVSKELKGLKTINMDTSGKIEDHHLSFKGHYDFAKHMWNKWFKEKSLI